MEIFATEKNPPSITTAGSFPFSKYIVAIPSIYIPHANT